MYVRYSAVDESGGIRVWVDEFFPEGIAQRDCSVSIQIFCSDQNAAERFALGMNIMKEQASLPKSSGITGVTNLVEENGTVYIVSEHIEWPALQEWMGKNQALSLLQIFEGMRLLAVDLEKLHEAGLFHGGLNLRMVHVSRGLQFFADKPEMYAAKYQYLVVKNSRGQTAFPVSSGIQLDRQAIALLIFKLASQSDLDAICRMQEASRFFGGFVDAKIAAIKGVFRQLLQKITNQSLEQLWEIYSEFLKLPVPVQEKQRIVENNPARVQNIDGYFPKVTSQRRRKAIGVTLLLLLLALLLLAGVYYLIPLL